MKNSSCLLEPPAAVHVAPDLLRLAVDALEALPVGRTKRDQEATRRQLDERAHVLARAVDWTAFQWFVVEGARVALTRPDARLHVTPPSGKHDKARSIPASVRRSVAERDAWSCRYCGIRLVSSQMLTRLERKLPAALPLWPATMGRQVLTVHPMQLVLRLTWDHVEPWWSGGASDEMNVVASCGACNFNKKDCSVDELALTDPRARPPVPGWDGFTEDLAPLGFEGAGQALEVANDSCALVASARRAGSDADSARRRLYLVQGAEQNPEMDNCSDRFLD